MFGWSRIPRSSALGRVLRLPLYLLPERMVLPILSGPNRGSRWRVGASVHGCWLGTYELEKQKKLATCVKPGMVVYDVGANGGFYTLLAARLTGPTGHVVAVEPLGENVATLLHHIRVNRLNNVTVVQAAATGSGGVAYFQIGSCNSTGSVTEKRTDLCVPTVTLDDLIDVQGLPAPGIVKVDVEGAEAAVLAGSRNLLNRREATWFISLHGDDQRERCLQRLSTSNYDVLPLVSDDGTSWTSASDEIIAIPSVCA